MPWRNTRPVAKGIRNGRKLIRSATAVVGDNCELLPLLPRSSDDGLLAGDGGSSRSSDERSVCPWRVPPGGRGAETGTGRNVTGIQVE